MEIEVKVEGLKELMNSMQNFVSPKLQQKLVQGSVRAAANVIKKEAERNLGKGKGYIGVGIPKKRRWSGATAAAMSVGIKKKHWQVIFKEFGTRVHEVIAGKRGKRTTGKKVLFDPKTGKFFGKKVVIPRKIARPFLRPAVISKQQEAVNRMRDFLDTSMKAIFMARKRDIQEPPLDLS